MHWLLVRHGQRIEYKTAVITLTCVWGICPAYFEGGTHISPGRSPGHLPRTSPGHFPLRDFPPAMCSPSWGNVVHLKFRKGKCPGESPAGRCPGKTSRWNVLHSSAVVCFPISTLPACPALSSAPRSDLLKPCSGARRFVRRSVCITAPHVWNTLPPHFRSSDIG